MNETRIMTIGEVCATISDTYRAKADEVTLINTSDVLEGKVLNHARVPNKELKGQFKKTFKKNDILYSEIRPQNKRFAFVDFDPVDYIASTKLMVLRADTTKVLPMYLYFYLKSEPVISELQMLAETRSGTFPQITFTELSNLTIPVPSIAKQKEISDTIQCIEDKMNCNAKINDNLQQQADAIFSELFLSDVNRSALTVADVSIKVTDGVHNTVLDDPNGDYYLLSCKNIKGGILSISNSERRISKETFEKLRKRTRLEKGDILLSSVGTVGELLLLKEIPSNYEFQRSVAMIKPNPAFVSSEYLYQALRSKKDEIIHAAHGAVQQCLFISDISDFQIPVPTKRELEKFSNLVAPMFSKIHLNECENKRLVALRDALLPKLLSAEIDVSDIQF